MTVEIYGLPAAGKTKLAQDLSTQAGYKIIKARTKAELIFYNMELFLLHPIKFFIQLLYVIKNAGSRQAFYHKLMNCFLHVNARMMKAKKFEKAVVDQGYFLNIFTIFERKLTVPEVKSYFKQIIKPDMLIILEVSPEVQAKRAAKRGYLARDQFGREYVDNWLGVMQSNDIVMKEALKDLNISYCIINGDREPEVVFNSAIAKINYEN